MYPYRYTYIYMVAGKPVVPLQTESRPCRSASHDRAPESADVDSFACIYIYMYIHIYTYLFIYR